jgi:hypothetical protein
MKFSIDSDLRSMVKGHKLHPIDPTMASRFNRVTKNSKRLFGRSSQSGGCYD